ncbi:MAG: hypothetical protein AAFU65_18525, partial [Pseudomonadota bacterium]
AKAGERHADRPCERRFSGWARVTVIHAIRTPLVLSFLPQLRAGFVVRFVATGRSFVLVFNCGMVQMACVVIYDVTRE